MACRLRSGPGGRASRCSAGQSSPVPAPRALAELPAAAVRAPTWAFRLLDRLHHSVGHHHGPLRRSRTRCVRGGGSPLHVRVLGSARRVHLTGEACPRPGPVRVGLLRLSPSGTTGSRRSRTPWRRPGRGGVRDRPRSCREHPAGGELPSLARPPSRAPTVPPGPWRSPQAPTPFVSVLRIQGTEEFEQPLAGSNWSSVTGSGLKVASGVAEGASARSIC